MWDGLFRKGCNKELKTFFLNCGSQIDGILSQARLTEIWAFRNLFSTLQYQLFKSICPTNDILLDKSVQKYVLSKFKQFNQGVPQSGGSYLNE